MKYQLHFQTSKPATSAASIHVLGCRHANLKPRIIEPLADTKAAAMRHEAVRDLLARGYGIHFAPCALDD